MSPFVKGDPKTIAAAKRGGTTGKKHFETVPKAKLRKLTTRAGKLSGEARRKKRARQRMIEQASKVESRIMHDYLI